MGAIVALFAEVRFQVLIGRHSPSAVGRVAASVVVGCTT
jgi:hypothetical protein